MFPGTASEALLRPIRTCVGCRRPFSKPRVIRFGIIDGGIAVDQQAELPGRGCYVCYDRGCIEKALQRDARRIQQALRSSDGRATVDTDVLRKSWCRAVVTATGDRIRERTEGNSANKQ